MTRRRDQAPEPSDTLWTAVAAAVAGGVLQALRELSEHERDQLRRQVARDAERDLPGLLRPFQAEVSRETVSRTFG